MDTETELLAKELASYDATIASARIDTALSETGLDRIISMCRAAKVAVQTYHDHLSVAQCTLASNATTISCSGKDITIACDDHDTKQAVMDALTGEPLVNRLERWRIKDERLGRGTWRGIGEISNSFQRQKKDIRNDLNALYEAGQVEKLEASNGIFWRAALRPSQATAVLPSIDLQKIADVIEPHWRGAGLNLTADWVIAEFCKLGDDLESATDAVVFPGREALFAHEPVTGVGWRRPTIEEAEARYDAILALARKNMSGTDLMPMDEMRAISKALARPPELENEVIERCAKVAENLAFVETRNSDWNLGFHYAKEWAAAAILALRREG